MKKIKLNPAALLKLILAFALLSMYWYWISQSLITESNNTFGLTTFFLLMGTATAYFPLPANILVLGAVRIYDPLLIAGVAGVATLIAYVSEYLFFSILFKFNKVSRFKQTWIYQKLKPLFEKHKFFILSFTSFLPIPSEALRIYAITQRYPVLLFALAGIVGRLPRYYLLGYYGRDYVSSPWFLLAVFVFPAVFLFVIRGVIGLAAMARKRYAAALVGITESVQTASDT
jgi:membrane protein YqaA with SNARE-associated domain